MKTSGQYPINPFPIDESESDEYYYSVGQAQAEAIRQKLTEGWTKEMLLERGYSRRLIDIVLHKDFGQQNTATVGQYVIDDQKIYVPEYVALKLDEWEKGPIADVAYLALEGSKIPVQIVLEAIDDLYEEEEDSSGVDQREIRRAIDYLEYAVDRSNVLTVGSANVDPYGGAIWESISRNRGVIDPYLYGEVLKAIHELMFKEWPDFPDELKPKLADDVIERIIRNTSMGWTVTYRSFKDIVIDSATNLLNDYNRTTGSMVIYPEDEEIMENG